MYLVQDHYVFNYNNLIFRYVIILIEVQAKNYLTLFHKRQYNQVRSACLIYVSMGTTLHFMSN